MSKNNPQHIIVHHTASLGTPDRYQLNGVNNYHRSQKYPLSSMGFFVGYHYLIEQNGKVIQCRREDENGAHTSQESMNFKSIGICLAGDFDQQMPTEEQKSAIHKLLQEVQSRHNIPDEQVVPHRRYAPKSCWGKNLPDNIVDFVTPKVSEWAKNSVERAKRKGITDWSDPQKPIDNTTLYHFLVKLKLKEENKTQSVSKEEMAVIFDRLGQL